MGNKILLGTTSNWIVSCSIYSKKRESKGVMISLTKVTLKKNINSQEIEMKQDQMDEITKKNCMDIIDKIIALPDSLQFRTPVSSAENLLQYPDSDPNSRMYLGIIKKRLEENAYVSKLEMKHDFELSTFYPKKNPIFSSIFFFFLYTVIQNCKKYNDPSSLVSMHGNLINSRELI